MNLENKEKEYRSSQHLVYSCQYHVIFCTKYRRRILVQPYEEILKQLFNKIADDYSFSILEMEVMPDHVHMLIDCHPKFGIYECVKKLKGISAHELRENFPELKSRVPSIWTRSSFISTVGSVSLETVKRYIENQKYV